jgi:hypothetical protein
MKIESILMTIAVTIGLTAETMAQNVPSYLPTNGLVGWWPFNGNANDESGNGNNGTVNGAMLTTDRFGNANRAYSFNGISDNIILNSLNISDLSVIIWFEKSSTLNTNPNNGHPPIGAELIGQGTQHQPNVTYSDFAFGLSSYGSSTEYFSFENSDLNNFTWTDYQLGSTQSLSSNWNCAVFTIQDSTIQLFINGQLTTSQILANAIFHSGAPLSIGARSVFQPFSGVGTSNFFSGNIDDIGIWNRALTQQEITDLYNGNICYQTITVTDTLLINMGITGYNPVTYNNTIKIFPNPTNDHITIDYGNFASLSGYQLKIINSLSQNVFQTNITQQSDYLNLTTWGGNGLYFVQIIDQQGNIIDIRKIVLQ